MSRPKRSADRVQKVYDVVQDLLASFEIGPSARVNEVEIATRLGVSRTPVREALNRLSTEGLVHFIPGSGFFCRDLTLQEIADLSQLRQGVESIAGAMACIRASDDAINELRRQWDEVAQRLPGLDARDLAVEDERFHEQLVHLAGNAELDRQIRRINMRLRFVRECAIASPRRRNDTVTEHREILAALSSRSAATARELIEQHVHITSADARDVIALGLNRLAARD